VLKVLGMILCSLSLCVLGFLSVWLSKKRLDAGKDAVHCLNLLATEICDLKKPISRALADLSFAGNLIKIISLVPQPWTEETLKGKLKETGLGGEETSVVAKLLMEIPAMPTGRREAFLTAIQELNAIVTMRQEALKNTGSLYPKLGLLSGALLLLLFL